MLRNKSGQIGLSFNAIGARSFFGCSDSTGVVYWRERFRSRVCRSGIRHPCDFAEFRRGAAASSARQCGFFFWEALGEMWVASCYGNAKRPRLPRHLAGQTLVHLEARLPQNFDRSRNIRFSREHHRTRFRHCSDQRCCTEKMFHANRTV